MSDKPCQCKFCIDYKRFKHVLPLIPLEHREWFESVFDSRWNAEEELSYKAAVLDGSWPDSVEILSHHLENARRLRAVEEPVAPQVYDHSCDVVDISDGPCGDPSHDEIDPPIQECDRAERCPEDKDGGFLVERVNSLTGNTFLGCSEFPECKYTKRGGSNPAPVVSYPDRYDYEDEDMEDDGFFGGDHAGDFF
jgi:hypothetical protein